MWRAAGEARKWIVPAISATWPSRFVIVAASNVSRRWLVSLPWKKSVSAVKPGATTFAVIPRGPSSAAASRFQVASAAFEAPYAPGPRAPAIDPRCTTAVVSRGANAVCLERERPGTPTDSIEIVTPLWRLAKLFADDRRWVLADLGVDPATLDLLSVLRRAGSPYELSTRELSRRTLVTAGAISQRVARAEVSGLVSRRTADDRSRAVVVTLTEAGHDLVERTVDQVLTRESELVASLSLTGREQLAAQLQELLEEVQSRARRA